MDYLKYFFGLKDAIEFTAVDNALAVEADDEVPAYLFEQAGSEAVFDDGIDVGGRNGPEGEITRELVQEVRAGET